MAHYAKVRDGKVIDVIVADQNFIDNMIDTSPGTWIQTSYNTRAGVHINNGTPLRKNYAGVGYIYDSARDAFYEPKPYPSWTLDENSCTWQPPVDYPDDGQKYYWNEETSSWVQVTE